jgi:hypothetical protein
MRLLNQVNAQDNSAFLHARAFKSKSRNASYTKFRNVRKYPSYSRVNSREISRNTLSTLNFYKRFIDSPLQNKAAKRHNKKTSYFLPKNFCFIENPNESLLAISCIVKRCEDPKIKSMTISHVNVKSYNLTSEVLLGVGVQSALVRRKALKSKLYLKGGLPENLNHKQLVSEIGIVKEINVKPNCPLPLSTDKQHLFAKQCMSYSAANAASEDTKTHVSVSFADHVDDCMKDRDLSLKREAKASLMKVVSEVLDNAERHSTVKDSFGRKNFMWYIRGYLNSHSAEKDFEISIFNFGMTIAETFEVLPDTNFSKGRVMTYANFHKNSQFEPDSLITIAALQQRYSSKNLTSEDTNGQGTVVLIQYFERLCKEYSQKIGCSEAQPVMSIVSGKTHIIFDGTYELYDFEAYTRTDDEDENLAIAFNSGNDLKLPPDPNYVRRLKETFFPGVAISIRFPLKAEEVEDERKNYDN